MLTINVKTDGLERLIENRIRLLPKIGRRAVDEVTQMHRAQMQRRFKGYQGDPNTGAKLQNRSGALKQRLAHRPSTAYPSDIRADSYVAGPLAYAKIQEFGGTIKPKKGKYLTIPLDAARTKAGTTRQAAQLVQRNGRWETAQKVPGAISRRTFIIGMPGRAIIYVNKGMGLNDVMPLYVLKRSVRIKPRLGFFDTFKAQKKKRRTVYRRIVKAYAEGRLS